MEKVRKEEAVILKEISYPVYTCPQKPAPPTVDELSNRLQRCKQLLHERHLTHLLVYGDREHFANLMYLVNFDPRFEEALLIIQATDNTPLLLVGNEGEGHLGVSPLWKKGEMRHERYQSFSLMDQPRNQSRSLQEIFQSEDITEHSKIGVVGWKYFKPDEIENHRLCSVLPSYLIDTLRSIVPSEAIENATDLLISPVYGLRSFLSVYEIAQFEYSNYLGSKAMKNILAHFQVGVTDYEMMQHAQYCGYPLACHLSIKSSGNQHYGLSSPTGDLIQKGLPTSISIAHWGSNICRAGWVAEGRDDLPAEAKNYVEEFAAPYFTALIEWMKNLRIGKEGGALHRLIATLLPFDKFHVFLNPGHLIHFDEWTTSPIYADSKDKLQSGMYIQSDIIPRSPVFGSSRMEEGYLLANEDLQKELNEKYPEVYQRCLQRRTFMESLGFTLPPEVLPLSDLAGIVVPYFLNHKMVLTLNSIK